MATQTSKEKDQSFTTTALIAQGAPVNVNQSQQSRLPVTTYVAITEATNMGIAAEIPYFTRFWLGVDDRHASPTFMPCKVSKVPVLGSGFHLLPFSVITEGVPYQFAVIRILDLNTSKRVWSHGLLDIKRSAGAKKGISKSWGRLTENGHSTTGFQSHNGRSTCFETCRTRSQ